MKSRLSFGLMALAFLAACSSTQPMNSPARSGSNNVQPVYPQHFENDQAPAPKVGSFTPGFNERAPAANERLYWVGDSKALTVGPGGLETEIMLTPTQRIRWEEQVRVGCHVEGMVNSTCTKWVCTGGQGKSELWDAYYSAKKEQKVAALDAALKGVSGSARKLHESGLLNKKPRSWEDFQSTMNTAVERGVITRNEYNEVFGTHANANRMNLGYGGENCRPESYSCRVPGLVWRENACTETREYTRMVSAKNTSIRLSVKEPQLQSFENESITVVAEEDFDSIKVLQGDKTIYTMASKVPTASGAEITLLGVGRNKIALPAQAFKTINFNDQGTNGMNVVIEVDPQYMGGDEDPLMFNLQVSHCKPGFFGGCKGNDRVTRINLPEQHHKITQAKSSFALPSIPAGHAIFVTYSVNRENSKWYSGAAIGVNNNVRLRALKK